MPIGIVSGTGYTPTLKVTAVTIVQIDSIYPTIVAALAFYIKT